MGRFPPSLARKLSTLARGQFSWAPFPRHGAAEELDLQTNGEARDGCEALAEEGAPATGIASEHPGLLEDARVQVAALKYWDLLARDEALGAPQL